MQAFTTLQGPAAPLMQANFDTYVIIRIERLANVERFFANCFQNGVLAMRFDSSTVADLARQTACGGVMTVDLTRQELTLQNGVRLGFDVDAMRREALLEGLDDIGQTLKRIDLISLWQQQDRQSRPWMWS